MSVEFDRLTESLLRKAAQKEEEAYIKSCFQKIAQKEQYPGREIAIWQSADWVNKQFSQVLSQSTPAVNNAAIVALNWSFDNFELAGPDIIRTLSPDMPEDRTQYISDSLTLALTGSHIQTGLVGYTKTTLSVTHFSPFHDGRNFDLETLLTKNPFWRSICKSMSRKNLDANEVDNLIRMLVTRETIKIQGYDQVASIALDIALKLQDKSNEITKHITGEYPTVEEDDDAVDSVIKSIRNVFRRR